MEETLKSIRLIHRVLLTLIVAVFLFALSPDREAQYKHAIGFLDKIEGFPVEEYRAWSENEAGDNPRSRNAFVESVFEEVRKRGGPEINWEIFKANGDDELAVSYAASQLFPSILHDKLEILNRQFRDDIFVQQLILPPGKLASKILLELKHQPKFLLDNFVFESTIGIGRADIQMYVYDPKGKLESVRTTIKYETRKIPGKSLRVWMMKNGYDHLVSKKLDDQSIVFEPLRPIWPFVRDKTASEAKSWIYQELLRADQLNTLTFLGFSVSEGQAAIVAPGLTCVLLLALAAHARHARRIRNTDIKNKLTEFPWVGIFPGLVGSGARIFTILVLPLLANSWLLSRTSGYLAYTGWGLIVILIPCAYWAFLEIRRLSLSKSESEVEIKQKG